MRMQERLLDERTMKIGIFFGMLWKVRTLNPWIRMGKDSINLSSLFLYSQAVATLFFLIFLLHSIQMESDDLKPIISCKRSRSPSEALRPSPNSNELKLLRQPKRQRKYKVIPDYNPAPDDHVLESMDRSNPYSRKILRRKRKR